MIRAEICAANRIVQRVADNRQAAREVFIFRSVERRDERIVVQSNSDNVTEEATEVQLNKRVPSDTFLEAFKKFEELNDRGVVKKIIGDSEKAFWSRTMLRYYERHGIEVERINVSQEGHLGMSILDRLVGTIRRMCSNMFGDDLVSPKQMIEVVVVYNNSMHHTFEHFLHKKITPYEMNHDRTLERDFSNALWEDNIKIRFDNEFDLRPGTQVVVRADRFDDTSKIAEQGDWYVLSQEGITFTVGRCDDREHITHQLQKIYRRDLRPIYGNDLALPLVSATS